MAEDLDFDVEEDEPPPKKTAARGRKAAAPAKKPAARGRKKAVSLQVVFLLEWSR